MDEGSEDEAASEPLPGDGRTLASPVLRSCLLVLAIGAVFMLFVSLLVAIVLVWRPFGSEPGTVDQAELDRTNVALASIVGDLEALGPVTGRAGEPVQDRTTCAEEEADDPLQPALTRSWPVEAGPATTIEDELTGLLTDAGWERQDPAAPGDGATALLDRDGTTFRAEVEYVESLEATPALELTVTVVGAEPCGG